MDFAVLFGLALLAGPVIFLLIYSVWGGPLHE